MIYETRTYRLKPRGVPEFIDKFGKAYKNRQSLSKISAFFYTEIGPLKRSYPYLALQERRRTRQEAGAVGQGQEIHLAAESRPPAGAYAVRAIRAVAFHPDLCKRQQGPIFEWREYQIIPGLIPELYKSWEKAIGKRTEMSELVMAMHTDAGDLNKFVHIWAYESLEHRAEVRAEAMAKGIWPPKGRKETLQTQANKIVLAAPFSPIQ